MFNVAHDVLDRECQAVLGLMSTTKAATVDVRWLENNVTEWLRQHGGLEWRKAIVPIVEAIVSEQGTVSGAQLGIVFDVRNPYASAFIGDLMEQFSKQVTQTSREAIAKELRAGDEAGESLGQLIQRIQGYYGANAERRAEITARSETLNAANCGAVVAYQEAGCEEWEFLATGDERTCRLCGPLSGKRYPIARRFEVIHPQCRCCALPVVR